MRSYYLSVAYGTRGIIGVWWVMALLIPATWSKADWPPISFLIMFYLGGAAVTSILWGASIVIVKVAGDKK